jgi:hypothetical protein
MEAVFSLPPEMASAALTSRFPLHHPGLRRAPLHLFRILPDTLTRFIENCGGLSLLDTYLPLNESVKYKANWFFNLIKEACI